MPEDMVTRSVALPSAAMLVRQPRESAELPDDGAVEWAPLAPYWSVLWRSGVALAAEVARGGLTGRRVIELGCGLGLPSLAAARAGANVLATDIEPTTLALLRENAELNGIALETAAAEWAAPEILLARGPFDLVLAADVLYERPAVAQLLSLLPRLAPEVRLADPGRPAAEAFLEGARGHWSIVSERHGVVEIHRLTHEGGLG